MPATSRELLEEKAAQLGLADKLPILVRHAREALLMETKVAQEPLRLGQSRVAGQPDLPPHFTWPKNSDGKDLLFLAQINLTELPESMVELPSSGSLYFFGSDRGLDGKVFHYSGSDLTQAPQVFSPPAVKSGFWKKLFRPQSKGLRLCQVDFRPIPSLPQQNQPGYQALVQELGLAQKGDDILTKLSALLVSSANPSKLLGFADQIQATDLGFESQIAFEQLKWRENIYEDPELEPQRRARGDWTLLFQLSSDDNANMMWGDAGSLYFMIRKQDLAASSFENVQLLLECF